MQLQAGFLIHSLKQSLIDSESCSEAEVTTLFNWLSHFELNSSLDEEIEILDKDSTLSILNNIIVRGLPTLLSLDLENKFRDTFQLFNPSVELGTYKNELTQTEPTFIENLYRALFIVDPRFNASNSETLLIQLESYYEKDFFLNILSHDETKSLTQLVELQREFGTIVATNSTDKNFYAQRVDFSFELPYASDEVFKKGIIFEVDGRHHLEPAQMELDNRRDQKANDFNWETIRIKTHEWNKAQSIIEPFTEYLSHSYLIETEKNYTNPIYETEEGLTSLQLILSPIAIARIQKTLIEFLLRGKLKLNSEKWRIAIIERDVPCGYLAITDFMATLEALLQLQDDEDKLPELEIQVYRTEEFITAQLNENISNDIKLINEFKNDNSKYDLVIDISILQREGLSSISEFGKTINHFAEIRSSFSPRKKRILYTSGLLKYSQCAIRQSNDEFEEIDSKVKILTKFLQDIFRKKEFRKGQIPILNRALQLQSVIGLLPTGGGKSLTYQIASLLQPGIAVVIDPIKSLMKDQVDGLIRNYIDCSLYINSSLDTHERKKAIAKVQKGEALFFFISPERFQIEEFRDSLNKMSEGKIFFSYAVIDEAHCVSEWGHDFRTSYLSLGKNAMRFCKTANLEKLPLFGLTATASYDVLADVQRELSVSDDDILKEEAIIKFETTNRVEIQYRIEEVKLSDVPLRQDSINNSEYKKEITKRTGKFKQDYLAKLLQTISTHIGEMNNEITNVSLYTGINSSEKVSSEALYEAIKIHNYDSNTFFDGGKNAGLIFTPHRTWVLGVTDKYAMHPFSNGVYDNLPQIIKQNANTFIGASDDDDDIAKQIDKDNIRNQTDFINNKLNLLVCTKAFGMGIDKSNVRYAIHFNYPSSIESFVQEAGRIGRDGKLAISYVLFNQQNFELNDDIDKSIQLDFHNNSFKGESKEITILKELFEDIKITNLIYIENVLKENFSSLSLSITNDLKLALNYKGGGCGKLNLHTRVFNYDCTQNQQGECQEIVKDLLINLPLGINLVIWLNKAALPKLSIKKKLEKTEINEKFQMTFGFSNFFEMAKKAEVIKTLLNDNTDALYQRSFIEVLFKETNNFNEFVVRIENWYLEELETPIDLQNVFTQQVNNNYSNNYKYLEFIYNSIRNKADTEKAIYRLATIGVIDDYTVDSRTSTFTIYATKKTKDEYKEYLRRFVRKYQSEKRTEDIIANIDSIEGDSIIWKALNYLISFIYKEIKSKRREAIDAMKGACIIGTGKNGNDELKQYIDLYFNSKYARKDYEVNGENASLTSRTEDGNNQNIEWVWEFINIATETDKKSSPRDNLKHLRGATIRMLIARPDNATLMLLKSFSVFIIEEDNISTSSLIDEAIDDYVKGFTSFRNTDLADDIEFNNAQQRYKKLLTKDLTETKLIQIELLLEKATRILNLSIHANWIENFNNEFLVDYGREN
ncbi:MAG: hypothetical protein COW71_16225 [Ignavibacteriales bacterium CG18_big_fil_WC_8_21_14_2_50_31_20]|nr:MAG: hypothetical protein COW71_16225 [Ignavibacteriales bacterium CG18_big_fil_WC_8_21_14_2_50_31_20]